ncbi:MAG: segregation/condensation protein A [Xanthomonadales bacterium]|nr:segregation/condensation protein A [Xanthomonadales bacterium]
MDPKPEEPASGRPAAAEARQGEMPFAIVQGQPYTELPHDLYIPPDALEVILEAFEGPLDLLLYLIRRQNLDILDIPIAEITRQYITYIEMLRDLQFELAAEYLVMAAILAEIKSRLLLPKPSEAEDEEADPRAELVRRLQEYERFKAAAENLDEIPRADRDFSVASAWVPDRKVIKTPPDVDLRELLLALKDVMSRAELFTHHHVQMEPLSVRERMSRIMEMLGARRGTEDFLPFQALFTAEEGRRGVVVSFIALMELTREQLIDLVQNDPMGPIYVKTAGSGE